MKAELSSIRKQIAEYKANLRLIEDRKSEYAEQTSVPLQLVKSENATLDHLEELRRLLRKTFRRHAETASLLPYLPDRIPQELHLVEFFENFDAGRPACPVVCLVSGGERECHDKFLERIQVRTLPDILRLDPEAEDATGTRLHYLRWPADPTRPERELLRQMAALELPRRGHERIAAQSEAVQTALATLGCPVILATVLATDAWQPGGIGEQHLRRFLEFWNSWPSLAPGQVLVVFFAAECRSGTDPSQFTGFAARNAEVEACFKKLRDETCTPYSRLHLTILPRLDSIPQQPVCDWARTEVARYRHVIAVDSQILVHRVTAFYADWVRESHQDAIPLQDLAEGLEDILSDLAWNHAPSLL